MASCTVDYTVSKNHTPLIGIDDSLLIKDIHITVKFVAPSIRGSTDFRLNHL